MSYPFFLLLIFLTFVRLFEAFAPELAVYQPILLLSLVVIALSLGRLALTAKFSGRPLYLILLGGFGLSIALSLVAAHVSELAVSATAQFITAGMLFVLMLLEVDTVRRLKGVFAMCVLGMLLNCVAGIAAAHWGFHADQLLMVQGPGTPFEGDNHPTYAGEDDNPLHLWRVQSLGQMSDPNDFAQAIVTIFPFLLTFAAPNRRWRNMVVIGVPTAVYGYALYLTHSRGGLLGLGAMLLVYWRKKIGTVPAMIVVGLLLAGGNFAGWGGDRAMSLDEESAGGRVDQWSDGLEMVRTNPIFGVGYDRFIQHSYLTAHNSLVVCMAETGLVGYFFWIGMLTKIGADLYRSRKGLSETNVEGERFLRAFESSLTGYLMTGFFLSRAYTPLLYVVLGSAGAATTALFRAPREVDETRTYLPWFAQTVGAMVGTVLFIYVFVRVRHTG